jgi:hypothetical protein
MELLNDLLGGLIDFLNAREWRKNLPCPESSFAAVLGLGTLQTEYARANWPSWTKITLVSLGVWFVFVIWLLLPIKGSIWFIFCLIILDIPLAIAAWNVFANWPGRTPRQVALFSGGVAWLEQGQIHTLGWQQTAAATREKNNYTVATTDG